MCFVPENTDQIQLSLQLKFHQERMSDCRTGSRRPSIGDLHPLTGRYLQSDSIHSWNGRLAMRRTENTQLLCSVTRTVKTTEKQCQTESASIIHISSFTSTRSSHSSR